MLVSLTAINSRVVNITWTPPPNDQRNGIIQYYQIKVLISETSEYFNIQTANLSLTLTDLHPDYTYTVSIAAVTIGTGPFSMIQSVTTPEDGRL